MSSGDPNQVNPYAPSAVESSTISSANADDAKLIKDFRSQSLALGVLWSLFGILGASAMILVTYAVAGEPAGSRYASDRTEMTVLGVILCVAGLIWLASGVLTLMKNMAGVYMGLVTSYMLLAANVLRLNPCGAVIAVLIIVQAHRVIGFARQMRSRNIPLNRK